MVGRIDGTHIRYPLLYGGRKKEEEDKLFLKV